MGKKDKGKPDLDLDMNFEQITLQVLLDFMKKLIVTSNEPLVEKKLRYQQTLSPQPRPKCYREFSTDLN